MTFCLAQGRGLNSGGKDLLLGAKSVVEGVACVCLLTGQLWTLSGTPAVKASSLDTCTCDRDLERVCAANGGHWSSPQSSIPSHTDMRKLHSILADFVRLQTKLGSGQHVSRGYLAPRSVRAELCAVTCQPRRIKALETLCGDFASPPCHVTDHVNVVLWRGRLCSAVGAVRRRGPPSTANAEACGVCASCSVHVQHRRSQLCTEVAQNSRRRRHTTKM